MVNRTRVIKHRRYQAVPRGEHRRNASHHDDGGGRRDGTATGNTPRAGLRPNAGLSIQFSEAGNRNQTTVASEPR
jgi:hypothetical protein